MKYFLNRISIFYVKVFCIELLYFVVLKIRNFCFCIICRLRQKVVLDLEHLKEHFTSLPLSSNPCLTPLPVTNIYIFLLLIYTDKLLSSPKTISFYCNQNLRVKMVNENQIQYHIQNLKKSTFLVNLTAPNKQFFRVKLSFKSCHLASNS